MDARPTAYERVLRFVRTALSGFFRRIEVVGVEDIPRDRGGLVVSWHPNGIVDPALIFAHFPGRITFGARHGLFKVPVFGRLLAAVQAVPIYRAMDMKGADDNARRAANEKSLDALAEQIAGGAFSALFPEGDSHDAPYMLDLKTGAARLYYRARQLAGEGPPPCIIAVGLHYDDKALFRSNALVEFDEPLALPPELDVTPAEDEDPAQATERARALTDHIEAQLRQLVRPTESWRLHFDMQRARQLVRAEQRLREGGEPRHSTIGERVAGFARIWTGYYERKETHPEQVAALRTRIQVYDRALRDLGVSDAELDSAPRLMSWWLPLLTAAQMLGTFLLLPPLVFLGYLVNLPPAALIQALAVRFARKKKDAASIKLVLGALVFPALWVSVGVGAAFAHDAIREAYPTIGRGRITAGVSMAVLSALGGAAALRYLRLAAETLRAVRVRITRERRRLTLAWLKDERARLFDALMAMAEGLDLPPAPEDGAPR